MTWRTSAPPWCLAILAVPAAVLAAGCGSAASTVTPGQTPVSAVTAHHPGKPMWLESLQMTSASAGWALDYPANPSNPSANGHTLLARTADGARTWADVTPAAARPLLATPNAGDVLDAMSAERAYLAVTGSAQESATAVNTTVVFGTADGGRTWTESARLRAPGIVSLLSFTDAEHGWLVLDEGAAMGQDAVRMYRTADGGRQWSLTAASPPLDSGASGGIPDTCDKTGVSFATATTGWLTSGCTVGLTDELLVSHDGGVSWAPQPLPLPAGVCGEGCSLTGPRFADGTGFLTVGVAGGTPSLLATRNLGRSWTRLPLPADTGWYPRITFFTPSAGILVPAGAQGTLGDVCYTTSNGGRSWTPVRQGTHFTQLGASINFVSPAVGFTWILGGDVTSGSAPAMYQTANSGRTWKSFAPELRS